MTDQEIVDGLINRDEKITDWFFNIKYRPLLLECNELYIGCGGGALLNDFLGAFDHRETLAYI